MGTKNSFDAKNAPVFKLKSATYNATNNTVTLTPKTAFALTKTVQLRVNGLFPLGLQDSIRRLIDGDHDGHPGGNAVALLGRGGVKISAIGSIHSDTVQVFVPHAADVWLKRENLIGVKHSARTAHETSARQNFVI